VNSSGHFRKQDLIERRTINPVPGRMRPSSGASPESEKKKGRPCVCPSSVALLGRPPRSPSSVALLGRPPRSPSSIPILDPHPRPRHPSRPSSPRQCGPSPREPDPCRLTDRGSHAHDAPPLFSVRRFLRRRGSESGAVRVRR
jgi:hypothetical protein